MSKRSTHNVTAPHNLLDSFRLSELVVMRSQAIIASLPFLALAGAILAPPPTNDRRRRPHRHADWRRILSQRATSKRHP